VSELESRTQFPGIETTSPRIVQYAALAYTTIDEDEQVQITDLSPTASSIFDTYYESDDADAEDEDEEYWYVSLTFFTSSGEEVRYFDDSRDDVLVGDVMSRVLAELGTKGWEAISVMEDADGDPHWYLKRVIA
jgi:hypothetical protein